ncbi:chymotrypsin-2 isoform X2 [Drosophila mojavensis]|uniref:Uncharacterized protein, isoform B n=1 Tax=Drosophila mojavensis TaxID=7230 RepID=A0A0Q9XJM9_DROMO|nr:chymotrypsin-2 isoform X2 [Drosophila mojavensis]KRG07657.1 uncharacterized protein Dmoj_GI16653, isoform B [Drosophila mojavensis]
MPLYIGEDGLSLFFKDDNDADFGQGFDVNIHEVPYIGTLRYYSKEIEELGSGMFCMAIPIKNRVLLSAAHCVFNKNHNDVVVILGSSSLRIRSPTTRMLSVSYWSWHPLYKMLQPPYDIAVVFTYDDIEPIAGAIQYAPLNLQEVPKGTKCLISSWTRLADGVQKRSDTMQAIWVSTLDRKFCFLTIDAPGYMCSKSEVSNVGVNTGDLGAPVVCNDKLSGITCFIIPTRGIAFNTAINVYAKWIRASVYLYFKGSPPTVIPTASTTATRRLVPATPNSVPLRSICSQWKVLSVISIHVIFMIPTFDFDFNL